MFLARDPLGIKPLYYATRDEQMYFAFEIKALSPKQKFSDGAGSIDLLAQHAEETIADTEFARERELTEQVILRSKEELLYYRIFRDVFGDDLSPDIVGTTRSITQGELH
jgi:asparagine synthetase B (glutamine-hydrolysing)